MPIRITKEVNYPLQPFTYEEADLIDGLRRLHVEANGIENHASQNGTYGAIGVALRAAIATAVYYSAQQYSIKAGTLALTQDEAQRIADCLYRALIENGGNIDYQVELWNDDKITVVE